MAAFDVQKFRARYRSEIRPSYNAWLHAGFVLAFGLSVMALLLSSLSEVRAWQWLAIPLTLVFLNWGEYQIHKNLGHIKRRAGALFYKRHTGDHHSFFVEQHMPYESAKDWRVILFPAWLVLVQSAAAGLIWVVLRPLDGNIAALVAATWVAGYLLYEVLHACEHLPTEHPVARLPWISQMRHLHALHHRRDLMHTHNFNIVFPLTDWLYGTLHWEPMVTRQRHVVQLDGTPEAVLEFACDVSQWPQWHPSSLKIYGRSGALRSGEFFEEDIRAGGRTAHLHWHVLDYQAGKIWSAQAYDSANSLWLKVTYQCQPSASGTCFERLMDYRVHGFWFGLLNRLVLQRKIERESALSLQQLQGVWHARAESGAPSPTAASA